MNNKLIKKVCVYCGSGPGINPIYAQSAEYLGKDLASNNIGLVYGGGSLGLMGIVAKSAIDNKGNVTGIIPEFLSQREKMLRDVNELHVTNTMHERKMMMFEESDAFVALPGGAGTLEELIEVITWRQLGQHDKPIVIANINNFWEPLMYLLSHMISEAFIREGLEVKFTVVNKAEDIVPAINGHINGVDTQLLSKRYKEKENKKGNGSMSLANS